MSKGKARVLIITCEHAAHTPNIKASYGLSTQCCGVTPKPLRVADLTSDLVRHVACSACHYS